jgi:hypothetical protein
VFTARVSAVSKEPPPPVAVTLERNPPAPPPPPRESPPPPPPPAITRKSTIGVVVYGVLPTRSLELINLVFIDEIAIMQNSQFLYQQ